jgi:hypothetical protein
MHTTLSNNSLLHHHWETFTPSSVYSSSSSSTGAIGGFEGITTSSTMIESSYASTKTKKIVETIWYLHSKKVDVFYLTN